MLNALSAETEKTVMTIFNKPIRLETVDSEACKRADFDQSSASIVMFTTVGYRLESGCLIITAVVEIYPKSEALLKFRHKPNNSNLMDIGNVIYRKTFTFKKEFITERNIKHNLSEGATSISKQIIDDLNSPL